MKCKNCGAELILVDRGIYFCEFCKSKYVEKTDQSNNEFYVVGGVLKSYSGNQSNVIIPNGIVSIGPNAFKNNILINSVTFPSSLTTIENNAFENCINLLEIKNYENVIFFKDECFKNSGLKELTIYPNVHGIGRYAFSYMPNLETVNYRPILDLKLKGAFLKCPKLITVNMNRYCFFPSMQDSVSLFNNASNKRPTWGDAFVGTPYINKILKQYTESYKQGICPECGGKIKKGLFHAKCSKCGIDYKN